MKNLRNSVQLIGNLGKDPILKEVKGGKKLVRFSLATNEYYKDNNGEKVQKTDWHNVIAWGKTAEFISESLSKGEQMMLNGRLTQNSFEGKDGQTKYLTEVVVHEFLKLSRKKDDKIPF